MVGEEENIFEVASGQGAKKHSVPKVGSTSLPSVPDSFPSDDKALQKRFEGVRDLRDQLEKSLDTIYSNTGLNKESVENFLDNPENFQELDFDTTQRDRKILRGEVEKMAGKDVIEKKEKAKKKKALKKRRRKSLGSRRNWIDMR